MVLRSEVADVRQQPVVNLCWNPRFERNLANGTGVRRNLAINPNSELSSLPWVGDGSMTSTRSSNQKKSGSYSSRFEKTTAGGSGGGPELVKLTGLRPNTTYTISFQVYLESGTLPSNITVSGTDYAQNSKQISMAGITPGAWFKRSITYVLLPNQNTLFVWGVSSNAVVFYLDEILVEDRVGPALPFFDGNTPNTRGIVYQFDGPVNASSSTAYASTVEYRRNFVYNPMPGIAKFLTSWQGKGSANTLLTLDTDNNRVKVEPQNAGTSGVGTTLGGLTVGQRYTAYIEVFIPGEFTTVQTQATVSSIGYGTSTAIRDQWITLSMSFTATSTTHQFGADYGNSQGVMGTYYYVRQAWCEVEFATGPNFTGYYSPDADLIPTWLGAEFASVSTLSGVRIKDVADDSRWTVIQTWAETDRKARILARLSNQVETRLELFSDLWLKSNLLPNTVYTVLASFELKTAQTGSTSGSTARGIMVHLNGTTYPGVQAPNVPGVYDLRYTFRTPLSFANFNAMRLYNGAAGGNGEVQVGKAMLVLGAYTGEYIDGDIPGCIWRGTPHDSTSMGYPQLTA